MPDKRITQEECKEWANATGQEWKGVMKDRGNFPEGCGKYEYEGYENNHGIYYFIQENRAKGLQCGTGQTSCVKDIYSNVPLPYFSKGRFVSSGLPDKRITQEECKEWANATGQEWKGVMKDRGNFPEGCGKYEYEGYENNHGIYYFIQENRAKGLQCGTGQTSCVKDIYSNVPLPELFTTTTD